MAKGHVPTEAEMVGEKFGDFEVVGPAPKKKAYPNSLMWRCKCACGQIRDLPTGALKGPKWNDCGCKARRPKYRNWKGVGDLSGAHWRKIVNRAKRAGIPLTIAIEDAWEQYVRQSGQCALTGLPLTLVTNQNEAVGVQTASLDRRDSSRGYEKGNIQWVHQVVNLMKLDHDQDNFIDWCALVARHNNA